MTRFTKRITRNEARPSHPVIVEILRRRNNAIDGNSAGAAASGFKLGLVVEGGGVRGIYSGGVMLKMQELGMASVFDNVYGESSGGPNCCYYLSGQGPMGIRVYLEDLLSPQFANPWRFWRMLDVDYVIDEVITKKRPLDQAAVLRSPSNLFISVTQGRSGASRVIDIKRDGVPLLTALRATAALVPLYDRFVEIDGEPFADGGIANPIGVRKAIDHGCTHILVLITQSPNFELNPIPWQHRLWMWPLSRHWTPEFRRVYFERHPDLYNEARHLALGYLPSPSGVSIACIAPRPESPTIGWTGLSEHMLNTALCEAQSLAMDAFFGS